MESVLCRHKVQSAQTTGNGEEIDLKGMSKNVTCYITGSAGVGAGAVQLETAPTAGYAGTWAALGGAPVTATASTTKTATAVGAYGFVRARISTNVTGGTVDVWIFAN